jgi:hypothetical protein
MTISATQPYSALGAIAGAGAAQPTGDASDGCGAPQTGGTKNDYVTIGKYRLHGWLVYVKCDKGTLFADWSYQWRFGQDSRKCDGCSTVNISLTKITGRTWDCGNLDYNNSLQRNNWWTVTLSSPWSRHMGSCGPQGDASGVQELTGIFRYTWYRKF